MNVFLKIFLIFGSVMLSGCGYDFKEEGLFAIIDTSKGEMVCKLNYDTRPITVGNFVGLAEGTREYTDAKSRQKVKKPFYDGLIFHRVIKDFMIQGGCPLGNGTGGPGYSFVDEFEPALNHDSKGVLSMANSGPGSNGSQFFITLGPAGHLDGKHTVWGKIVHGMDVLEKIGNMETDRANKPVKDIVIYSIRIKRVGKDAQAFDAEKAFAKNEEFLKIKEEEQNKQLSILYKKLGISGTKIITTGSGLKYFVKRNGMGSKPEPGDIITAHYTGYLPDGTKFDSSYDRGQPFEVAIGTRRVIQGWDEAFVDMKRGEKRVLIIPYNLAYGESGRSPVIPPRAILIFDVELIKFRKN